MTAPQPLRLLALVAVCTHVGHVPLIAVAKDKQLIAEAQQIALCTPQQRLKSSRVVTWAISAETARAASGSFPDANALLAERSRRGLEGLVAKREDAPYRLGTRSGWVKVKPPEWKAANQYRAKLLEKS